MQTKSVGILRPDLYAPGIMKKIIYWFLLSLALIAFSGCPAAYEEPEEADEAEEEAAAPTGPILPHMQAIQHAEVRMATIAANEAVRGFQTFEGRLPQSLNELIGRMGVLPNIPAGMSYAFNAQTGEITIERQ